MSVEMHTTRIALPYTDSPSGSLVFEETEKKIRKWNELERIGWKWESVGSYMPFM